MNQGWIARLRLASAVFVLTACGGSGSGTDNVGSTSTGTGASEFKLNPSLGGNASTSPDTTLPPADGSGTPNPGSGHTPDPDPGQAPDNSTGTEPPAATACNDTISGCFDVGQAQVAKFKDNKKAAASYTFDDGYQTSFAIASLFESRGLRASFYLIAGLVPDTQWGAWKALAAKGHEIGTHSMTHRINLGDPALTDAALKVEITDAQAIIGTKLGIVPQVFAFPWHSYMARSRSLALQTHLAIRSPDAGNPFTLAFFDQDHTTTLSEALANVNAQLARSVSEGGWYVAAGHGIDGDGWSPVTTQFLDDHLTFAGKYASQLWIDTYLNVARYRKCSAQATAQITLTSAQTAAVRLDGTLDMAACTEPLTVAIPVLGQPAGAVSAYTAAGTAIPVKFTAGKLLVDVRPGAEVIVEIARTIASVNP